MNIKTLAIAITAAALSLSACNVTGKNAQSYNSGNAAAFASEGKVTKTLNLKNFSKIKSSLNVDISYTQGNSYKVTVSGTAEALARADISVSGGTLTIEQDNSRDNTYSNGSNKLHFNITAPHISDITNHGRMDFTTSRLKGKGTDIENNGVLQFSADEVVVETYGAGLKLTNHGRADITIGTTSAGKTAIDNNGILTLSSDKMNAGSMKLSNYGRMDFSADVKASSADLDNNGIFESDASFTVEDSYEYTNYGRCDFTGDITAKSIDISNSGIDQQDGKLKADALSMDVNGRSDYNLSFSGGTAKLTCSGIGDFNLSVDCQRLNVEASGRIDVRLSGTADNTEFTGAGISNIDTSKLNKF